MTTVLLPPRVAEQMVAALIPEPELRDSVLGDLYEDHAALAVDAGPRAAARWYWSQALRSTPRLLSASAARLTARDWLTMSAVVIGAYACLAALVVASTVLIDLTLARRLSADGVAIVSLLASAACGVGGGYVAALLGRRAPLASAIALGAFCSVVAVAMIGAGPQQVPRWYSLGLLLIVLPATTTGGLLRVIGRLRRR